MSVLTERMAARLTADKEARPLPAECDPKLVVPVIATYLQGMWQMAVVSYDRPELEL